MRLLLCLWQVGTFIGQSVVTVLLRRTSRQSIIVLIIALIIGGSTIVMATTGVLNLLDEVREGRSQGLRELCTSQLVDD